MDRLAIIMIMIFTLFCGHSKGQTSTGLGNMEYMIKRKSLDVAETSIKTKIVPGWNTITFNTRFENPVKMSFKFTPDRSYHLESQVSLRKFEKLMGIPITYLEDDTNLKQKIRLKGKDGTINGTIQLMQCSDQTFMQSQEFGVALKIFK